MDVEKDLQERAEEVVWLAQDAAERLAGFQKQLEKHSRDFLPKTSAFLKGEAEHLRGMFASLAEEAKKPASLHTLAEQQDQLRTCYGLLGSVLSAGDWQSPSFEYTVQNRAGVQAGRIKGTLNDYKRDQHLDGEAYETAFARAYIPFSFSSPLPLISFLASSGMAAWSTVMQFVLSDPETYGPIFAGNETYFQCKRLLERFGAGRLQYVDEMDTDAFLAQVEKEQPGAIFLDTLGNTPRMGVPDLARLIPGLRARLTHRCFLVIDNSILGPSSDLRKHMSALPSPLVIMVVESLNKLYQFGMDRVTGGVMWSNWIGAGALFTWRMHLGTNIPDASVLGLPTPNRAALDRRLARVGRNTQFLAQSIDACLGTHPHSPISHVVYPGLSTHAAHAWMQETFAGPFFVLAFRADHQKVATYQRFVKKILEQAKKMQIDLVAGTSFGMNATRVYLTALHTDETEQPFVRISVGTETEAEMERMAELFAKVIEDFS